MPVNIVIFRSFCIYFYGVLLWFHCDRSTVLKLSHFKCICCCLIVLLFCVSIAFIVYPCIYLACGLQYLIKSLSLSIQNFYHRCMKKFFGYSKCHNVTEMLLDFRFTFI